MSFQQALSGLNASSMSLDAIGNNIANSNTVGYKMADARFADAYANAMLGNGTSAVGIGANVMTVQQLFTQGNMTTTSNPLDISVNGAGMFRLDNNGAISYTRNGQFLLDKEGYVINNTGLNVTGYAADPLDGTIAPGSLVPLRVSNDAIQPKATTSSQTQVNLDSRSKMPLSMIQGTLTGSVVLPTSLPVVASPAPGANDQFMLEVDGDPNTPVLVTLAPNAVGYPRGDFVAEVQRAINAALKAANVTETGVNVTLDAANKLVLTSTSVGSTGSRGLGSYVTVTDTTPTNGAYNAYFGTVAAPPIPSTGAWGYALGGIVPALAGGDTFDIKIDNMTTPVTVTVTAGPYATAADLATQMTKDINAALAIGNNGAVSVTVDPVSGALKVASMQTTVTSMNRTSQVTLSGVETAPGPPPVYDTTGLNALFGTLPSVAPFPPPAPGSIIAETGRDMDNFDIKKATSYTASTAQTVYDTLGNPHTLSLYYVKTQIPNQWDLYTSLETGKPAGPTRLIFNTAGALTTPGPLTTLSQNFDITTGATTPLKFTLDLTGTTQYGVTFGTNQLVQDGYTSGRLAGLSVSQDGIVQGRYSNGKSRNMGQLVLANFNNPNGLASLGNNQWAETSESGAPIPGAPGTANLGVVKSGAVEEANVDLTKELVNMITAQRAYQANAQTIKTQDQIMQTLVNLR